MGSGHAHGAHRAHRADGDGFEVARGPRAVLLACLALAAVVTVAAVVWLWPDGAEVDRIKDEVSFAADGVTFPNAVVQQVAGDGAVEVIVQEGTGKGDQVTVRVPPQVVDAGLREGDEVKLQRIPATEGTELQYSFFETVRSTPLLVMTLAFVVLVLLVARWRGLFALLGLVFSGVVIWKFLLPALLTGAPALAVGLAGSALIMYVVLYTTHGFSLRTSTALAGTLVGVLVTAALGTVGAATTRATGVTDNGSILQSLAGDLSFQGLFTCAIVIAGLGVLNDVTITQSSAVWEIRGAGPALGRRQVFTSGMRIGRDHIASTIYTIVFAYAGTALAVLLILQLYGLPFSVLLTTEDVTEEIVRTLASSIGLVLAVPLTTGIAALVVPGPSSE
ncbi:YibE/F family protein [Nocardioides pyridinolyticus]